MIMAMMAMLDGDDDADGDDGDAEEMMPMQMEAKMDVCMAGRVAEELIFGSDHVTSGASSDFEQVRCLVLT